VIRASTKTSSSPPPTTTKGITPPKLCLYPPYC
jgi:hypothetical protein